MKRDDLISESGLEERHYKLDSLDLPVIEASLYTTLGRRLFEFYQKYNMTSEDQREIERLSFLLMTFTVSRSLPKPSLWVRFRRFWGSN